MSTNIYVGNLPFNTTEDEVRDLFTAYGTVTSVTLIVDRETGRLRGFGFVEMEDDQEAGSAIEALNGSELQGRALTVNVARPREDRRGGGGNRGGGRDRRW
jgi:RNA recognition motif-containing protein